MIERFLYDVNPVENTILLYALHTRDYTACKPLTDFISGISHDKY